MVEGRTEMKKTKLKICDICDELNIGKKVIICSACLTIAKSLAKRYKIVIDSLKTKDDNNIAMAEIASLKAEIMELHSMLGNIKIG